MNNTNLKMKNKKWVRRASLALANISLEWKWVESIGPDGPSHSLTLERRTKVGWYIGPDLRSHVQAKENPFLTLTPTQSIRSSVLSIPRSSEAPYIFIVARLALLFSCIPNASKKEKSGGEMAQRNPRDYRNPCLTMHQPWASLLVYGIKRIEGRSWPAPIRGNHIKADTFFQLQTLNLFFAPFCVNWCWRLFSVWFPGIVGRWTG